MIQENEPTKELKLSELNIVSALEAVSLLTLPVFS